MNTRLLIVASITVLLTYCASAQQQSGQSVPDAPQPQKKAAPQPPASTGSAPTDNSAPKQPPAKDDNAFPEDVSRAAAKTADAADPKHPTADDNPFPEAVSRDAAKAAGNDPATQKPDLPPGVSSSQSGGALDDADQDIGAANRVTNPALAKKDTEVGGFYLKAGDYQGALLRYQDAISADPANVEAIFGLAESQQMLKKNADAARNYQLYLEIVPNGPRAKQALKALKTLQPGK
jgi:tetratricopeptide (TPR) repeat protein